MSIFYQTLGNMSEAVRLPPAHQSWHEFMRVFEVNDEWTLTDFAEEVIGSHSVDSMLNVYTSVKDLVNSKSSIVEDLAMYFALDNSIVIEKLAPLLYE